MDALRTDQVVPVGATQAIRKSATIPLVRISFDSLTLRAITHELQPFVGSTLQRVFQPDAHTLVFELFGESGLGLFLMSSDPTFYRAHFVTRRPPKPSGTWPVGTLLNSRTTNATLTRVEQQGVDRVLTLSFQTESGPLRIVGEFLGTHANLLVLHNNGTVLACTKTSRSKRLTTPGKPYEALSPDPRPSYLEAEELSDASGVSPTLKTLFKLNPLGLKQKAQKHRYEPTWHEGAGAYPFNLGLPNAHPRATVSLALEHHFAQAIPLARVAAQKASLLNQLRRVVVAREAALHDLGEMLEAAKSVPKQQMMGELLLAYKHTVTEGDQLVEVLDYEGNPLKIKLDPERSVKENAQSLFDKAKRVKSRMVWSQEHWAQLEEGLATVNDAILRLERAQDEPELDQLYHEAREKRWLFEQAPPKDKEDRPFAGHRIRSLTGPGGYTILYGENSTANDYLTTKFAKPNDIWLHVRGDTSAHVIIQTQGVPEKVQRETLMFAAKICVTNSSQKHSKYVSVDYTLKKYVRKPRGSAPGSVIYEREKTLSVDQS